MSGLPTRLLPTFLVILSAAASLTAAVAGAQGFSSVSSGTPTPSVTAPAAALPLPAASAATTPVPPAAGTPAGAEAPAAQLAALAPGSTGGSANLAGAGPDLGPVRPFEQADKLIVDKSDRKLYLLRQGRVVAEYPVKLGLNPYGHKQQEGDFRTPEGKYALTRRNPRSEFFLSIQVSYPNREDAAWAKENGWSPGGLIMIHGQPNVPKRPPEFYASRDWTDGCIALTNADMVDVWLRTSVGLPIEIRP
ncbi:MAG TPA: L,D-transpeptidase family protein [Steroidobacteraceae bacterium]